jgi:hypothetical protein
MVYTLGFFFLFKCSLFHNSNVFGSYIIHILYTECAKIKKIIPAPKGYVNQGINISKLASGCNTPCVNPWCIYNITGRELWGVSHGLKKKNKRERRREREATGQAFETTNTPTGWTNQRGSAPE